MATDDLIARLLDATDDAAGASVVDALHKLLDCSTFEADALPKTIAEAAALKDAMGIQMYAPGELMLAAYRGRQEEASPLISAGVSKAVAGGEGLGFDVARWAASILQNGLGGYAEAAAAAEQVVDEMLETNMTGWALAELVEGAVRERVKALVKRFPIYQG